MKKSLKSLLDLTAFELERISKFLYVLIGITLASNLTGYIWRPLRYVNTLNSYMAQNAVTSQQALETYRPLSYYNVISSVWVLAPVALGISGLLLYSLFIWYREWMGKNTFAYRLLMLPVPRMHLFYSKFIIIYLSIFTLIAVQIVSLFVGFQIVSAIVPGEWLLNLTFVESLNTHPLFYYILPIEPLLFLSVNGIGLVFMLVLFTIILMERSFSVKGVLLGIAYAVSTLSLAILPLFLSEIFANNYLFYPSEILGLIIVLMLLISFTSIMISRHLLNKKVTI